VVHITHIARRANALTHIAVLWHSSEIAVAMTHIAIVWHRTVAALAITDAWPTDFFHLAVYLTKCNVNALAETRTITCTLRKTGVTIYWTTCLRQC